MHHHDERKYDDAVDDAHKHLEREIAARHGKALTVVNRVRDEVPLDHLVDVRRLDFLTDPEQGHVRLRAVPAHKRDAGLDLPLHKNALQQTCTVLGMSQKFVSDLLEHESKERAAKLLTHNLNELVQMAPERRILVRRVKDDVRSVVSDSYLRMSGPQLIEAFASTCMNLGAKLFEGSCGDLRFSLKAVIAQVRRVGPAGREELITWGVALSNSDHGCGALSLQLFVLRVWCTNTAKTENALRKVHLGRKLEEDVVLRADTVRAETEANCKILRDNIRGVLAPARVESLTRMVDQAMQQNVDTKKVFDELGKRPGFTKGLVKQVQETFDDDALGVQVLPQHKDAWRLSNTLSWLAQTAPKLSAEDRMMLEDEAGRILTHGK